MNVDLNKPAPMFFDAAFPGYPADLAVDWNVRREDGFPDLLECIDMLRLDACRRLEQSHRGEMGQFLTPAPIARLMASMFDHSENNISILDAGAGIGSLFAACVAEICLLEAKPATVHVTAYEIDPLLLGYLNNTIEACHQACSRVGIAFTAEVRPVDFIKDAAEMLAAGLSNRAAAMRLSSTL